MRFLIQAVVSLVILAGAVGVAMWLISLRETIEPVPPPRVVPVVDVLQPEPQLYVPRIRTHGEVRPRRQATLAAQVAGRVTWVHDQLVPGAFVEEGAELMRIEALDYEAAVTLAEAARIEAETLLVQEIALGESARSEYERNGQGEPSPLVLRLPQREQAQARVAAAEASLNRARLDLERTTIRAPFAARVRAADVAVGQVVQPGARLGELASTDVNEVKVLLRDSELEHLDLPLGFEKRTQGAPVTLSATLVGERRAWEGYVDRVDGELDPTSRMAVAYVAVPDPYGRLGERMDLPLLSGLFVNVEASGRPIPDALVVPRSALQGGDRLYVMVDTDEEGAGILRLRDVEVAFRDREHAVLVAGLDPGDSVIVSPLATPVDGMSVRVDLEPVDSSPPAYSSAPAQAPSQEGQE